MGALHDLPFLGSFVACAVAAVSDVKTRKIPNAIPIALAIFGLAYHAIGGWHALLPAVAAGALVLVAGTLPFSLGWIGGGDVKLVAACACAIEWTQVVPLLLYTALAGGLLALVLFALRRFGRLSGPVEMPYAVAICAGVAWLGLESTVAPMLRIV